MARCGTGTIGMGVRWCDPSDGVTRRGCLTNGPFSPRKACQRPGLHERSHNASRDFTTSIIFPFNSVISPHRTREHESPVSGFQASAVRLCCVLASVPTPCSLGRNKSLCCSHHARGFYHTACLQILNNVSSVLMQCHQGTLGLHNAKLGLNCGLVFGPQSRPIPEQCLDMLKSS